MALDKGETALAEVAKRKAEQIESEALGKETTLLTFEPPHTKRALCVAVT